MAAWADLLAEEALVRAQHVGPHRAEVRRARVPFYRAVTAELIERNKPGLDPDTKHELIDLTLLLTSSAALFEFLDVLEVPAERGARLAARTVTTLLSAQL